MGVRCGEVGEREMRWEGERDEMGWGRGRGFGELDAEVCWACCLV